VKRRELTAIILSCKAIIQSLKNEIHHECVPKRAKRGKFEGCISGNTSPMNNFEPYLI
jgi:hypothetical protein